MLAHHTRMYPSFHSSLISSACCHCRTHLRSSASFSIFSSFSLFPLLSSFFFPLLRLRRDMSTAVISLSLLCLCYTSLFSTIPSNLHTLFAAFSLHNQPELRQQASASSLPRAFSSFERPHSSAPLASRSLSRAPSRLHACAPCSPGWPRSPSEIGPMRPSSSDCREVGNACTHSNSNACTCDKE